MSEISNADKAIIKFVVVSLLFAIGIGLPYILLAQVYDTAGISVVCLILAPIIGWHIKWAWQTQDNIKGTEKHQDHTRAKAIAIWAALPLLFNLLALYLSQLEYDKLANVLREYKFWSLLIVAVASLLANRLVAWVNAQKPEYLD